jgi:hypothetical protein
MVLVDDHYRHKAGPGIGQDDGDRSGIKIKDHFAIVS